MKTRSDKDKKDKREKSERRRASTVTLSSGNVFRDLGLPHPEERLAKAELTLRIVEILRERGLTQTEAAAILGVDQPKVSALIRGQLRGFSTERLFRFLHALGNDIEISIVSGSARGHTARKTPWIRVV